MNNEEQDTNDIRSTELHKANVSGGPSLSERTLRFRLWNPERKVMTGGIDLLTICMTTDKDFCKSFQNEKMVWMEFTGLKDKNGKEIYESDILKIKTQSGRVEYFVVKWGIHRRDMKSGWTVDIPGYAFVSSEGFSTFPIVNNYLNGHDLDIIEIVGNIYESPELLAV